MATIYLLENNKDLSPFFNSIAALSDPAYQLSFFSDIHSLAEAINSQLPDLLLFSGHTDCTDSFELYTQVLNQLQEAFISRIVISTEENVTASAQSKQLFNQSDDYLTFKDDKGTFFKKIDSHIKHKTRVEEVKKSLSDTSSIAENVIQLAGDMGEILHFSQECSQISKEDDLAENILAILSGYKVKAILMLKEPDNNLFFSNSERISELDKQIMHDKDNTMRFVDFGIRTQINFPLISVLVKNMPKNNHYDYMRIKDNIIYLLHTVNNILSQHIIQKKQRFLLNKTEQNIELMNSMFNQLHSSQQNALASLRHKFDELILSLGLTEEQEDILSEIIQDTENKTDELYNFIHIVEKLIIELRDDMKKIE